MAKGGIEVALIGAERFEEDLWEAVAKLDNLIVPMRQTSQIILKAAKATVPRLTGALAASMIPQADRMAASVSSPLVYASVIHWGWPGHNIESNPWLLEAARRSEPQWIKVFEKYIEEVISEMDKVYAA